MSAGTSELTLPPARSLPWSARVARRGLFERLAALPRGRLVIEDTEGTWRFGSGAREDLVAHVQVLDPGFYIELARGGSVAAGEAWVRGEWSTPDLLRVMQLMAANVDLLNTLDDRGSLAERLALRVLHHLNRNSVRGSRRNIEAHYDLGNALFETFLDPSMMYSSALFPHRGATLEEASEAKLRRVCEQLELGPDDHLLEIGTGWGGMAEYAARHTGCRVTTTTISREQHAYATQRIRAAGLADRVTVLLEDYRALSGRYDKLVSIEMIEAVGHRYLPHYFRACGALLEPHGLMLLQSILIPDQRYERARRSVDFIQRYIFPGGFLPSTGAITALAGSWTDLQLVGVHDLTADYALTLAEWRRRFNAGTERIRAQGHSEDFLRLWNYYFCYCEGGFRERAIGTAQFLFAKPGYRSRDA